jgi:subtilisin family serine protease/fibronectin type 3 domain-containing protein
MHPKVLSTLSRCSLALLLTATACQPGPAPPAMLEQNHGALATAAAGAAKAALRQERRQARKTLRKALNHVEGGLAGHYIVILDDTGPTSVTAAAQRPQIAAQRLAGRFAFKRKQLLRALQGFSIDMDEGGAAAVGRAPDVAYVVEDVPTEHMATQSNAPWGLDRIDQRALPLETTYSTSRTGKGVQVYLLDTGTLPTHSELAGKVSLDLDLVGDGRAGIDCDGHGTHVAGTIVGKTYGVAKDARLHSLRVLDCNGSGFVSDVMAGLDWVINNHIKPAVVNLSLGGPPLDEFDQVVRAVITAGIPVVVAAGNQGTFADDYSPSRVNEAIVVGATDVFDARADFSNFGRGVDVFAPGAAIASAWNSSPAATATLSGTSMATPLVTGTVALFLEANKTATPAAVETAILTSCTRGVVKNPGPGPLNRLLFTGLTAPTARAALFVVGSTNLSAADAALRGRLQARGFAVTLKTGSALTASDASGKALVLVSASVDSSDVGSKLTGVATPVMSLEGYIFDDLKMTGSTKNVDYGQMPALTSLQIQDDFNPLAAGLRGTRGDEGFDEIVAPSTAGKLYWGVPSAGAIGPDGLPVTHLGDPGKAAIFGYEKGATMVGRTAPARRLGFFADEETVRTFTAEGWALFDGAVEWASGAGPDDAPVATGLQAGVASKKVTLDWTAFSLNLRAQIGRATRRGGPYTLIKTTTAQEGPFYNYVDSTVSNGQTYYYVVTPLDAAGKTGHSSSEVQARLSVPGAPSGVQVVLAPFEGGTTISWTRGPGSSETRLARGDSSLGPFTDLATLPAPSGETIDSYNDQTVVPQHRYYYVLTPANAFGAGPATQPLEVVTETPRPPAVLTGLGATPIPGGVRVNWNHVVGVISYQITAKRSVDQTDLYSRWTAEPDATLWLPADQDVEITVQPVGHLVVDPATVSAHAGIGGALLVVGQTPLRAGDTVLAARLTALGLPPVTKLAQDLTADDLTGKQLAVVSSTAAANLPALLTEAALPVLNLEPFALGALRLTDPGPGTFGVLGNQNTFVVTTPVPLELAAGETRSTEITTGLGNLGWGLPLPGAIRVAAAPGATTLTAAAPASVFGYESGAALAGGAPAPARRVAWLADADALPGLTLDGAALLDAAVRWAIDPAATDPAAPAALVASAHTADVGLSWAPVPGAQAYAVYRASTLGVPQPPLGPASPSPLAPELIATAVPSPSYVDASITSGVLYTYFVHALSMTGAGPVSGAASAGVAPPPARPSITATGLDRSVRLSINATGAVASLRVKRATDSGGPYTSLASNLPAATTSYTATSLANGTPYYFVVEAVNTDGVTRSLEAFAVPGLAPAAPTGLAAVASNGRIALSWTPVAGARAYRVARAIGSATAATDLVVAEGFAATVTDFNVKNGQPFKYFVTALGDPGVVGATATVTATARGKAVFVRTATATAGDSVVRDRLLALGFDVLERSDAQLVSGDVVGKDVVVVSNAVNSATMGTKLTNVSAAVLTMESYNFGDLKMTGPAADVDFGGQAGQTQIDVSDATSPLAAGLASVIDSNATAARLSWGLPGPEAAIVARLAPGAAVGPLPVIFAYQTGSAMVGLVAPGRRVGFFADPIAAASLTTAGRALLDAAVIWSAGLGR